jgi:heme/copper-type cytochrome/quinol oxidase subunit 1
MPLYVLGFMGMTRRMKHYDNPAAAGLQLRWACCG